MISLPSFPRISSLRLGSAIHESISGSAYTKHGDAMFIHTRNCILLAALLPGILIASGQQEPTDSNSSARSVHLNVVVAPKSGPPVSGLRQQDFTLLDNNSVQPIRSFRAVSKGQEPVEVILLIDAVNTRFDTVAYERNGVQRFLRANGGHLAYPTMITVLTDQGAQMQKGFSSDGNSLSAYLDHYTIGLREITNRTGIWGADDRVQISLTALRQVAGYGATIPGRKIVLWISPGWPLLSGARIYLDSKQQQQIFGDVVFFSTQLRLANVTLYNINPLGPGEPLLRTDYYQSFLKGIKNPNQTNIGDLGLQVLAVQSGGLALESDSDVTGMLQKCLADLESWYEINFNMRVPEQPNEYHHVEIKVDKPGLNARTRDGYYAQP
jgi:VWFA-related protein